MEEDIRWKVTDPLGNEVILKESTFKEHIKKDHLFNNSEYRQKAEILAKEIIKNPQFLVVNKKKLNRHVYYKIVTVPCGDDMESLKVLKIVANTDRDPNEIVTWMLQSKLKDKIKKEWIIHAS